MNQNKINKKEKKYITKKIKFFPNSQQKKYFSKCFGTTRYLYNKIVDYVYKEEEKNYKNYLELSKNGCCHFNLKKVNTDTTKDKIYCCQDIDSTSKFFCKKHINSKIKKNYKLDRISLRNKLFPNNSDLTEDNKWLKEIPYDTRQLVITEFLGAYDSAMTNLRNGNIKKFKMGFKSRKNINHIFHCDHRTLKIINKNNKLSIELFPKLKLGNLRFRKKERKKLKIFLRSEDKKSYVKYNVDNDFKIMREGNDYYVLLSIEQPKIRPENIPLKVVSLDPGKRTFQTFYSPDGIAGKLGDNYYDNKINPINKRIDILCSKRDKIKNIKNKTKENKRSIRNINRRLSLLRTKIKNKIRDLHLKKSSFLCSNFENIIITEFETQKMSQKDERKINKSTTRGILSLSHFSFRQRLIHQCTKQKNLLIITEEPYTSKTCSNCGNEQEIGSKKTFECEKCKIKIDRDYNGARNILLRTLTKHSIH